MAKIAVIGANYLQLPLVTKALELGHETICFAWEEGAVAKETCTRFYPISIIEKKKILDVCKKEKIDAILTIASDVAMPTVSYVAKKLNLVANTIESTLKATNKYEMRIALKKHKLKVPKFIKVTDYHSSSIKDFNFPIISKPVDSSGSKGVQIVGEKKDVENSVKEALQYGLSKEVILEEFIVGKEISVETISYNGEHTILTKTEKVTSGPPNFVELEQHQPYDGGVLELQINEISLKVLNALGIEFGASHIELLITPKNEIYIIEVGGRMGGDFIGSHLVELSTGYDFLKGVIDVALGSFSKPNLRAQKKYSGVYFLSSETLWVAKMINSYKSSAVAFQKGKNKTELNCSGDRFGYFMYQINDIEEVKKIKVICLK